MMDESLQTPSRAGEETDLKGRGNIVLHNTELNVKLASQHC